MEVLSYQNPRILEFFVRLSEPALDCSCTLRFAERLLEAMGGFDIPASIAWLNSQGGYCDCEVMLNVSEPFREWLEANEPDAWNAFPNMRRHLQAV